MLLTGSLFAVSSSAMPFLKALMPPATSLISSEILPRPNSSITTTMTISQCQILNEPIGNSSAATGLAPAYVTRKLGFGRGKNKEFSARHGRAWTANSARNPSNRTKLTFVFVRVGHAARFAIRSGRLLVGRCRGRQCEIEIAGVKRLFVVAQCAVVRGDWDGKAGRQAAYQQAGTFKFLEPRQITYLLQSEVRQERLGRAVSDWTTRSFAAAAGADPAGL